MNILITCGETSGEYNASLLVSEIKKIEPESRVIALGGESLKEAGAEVSFSMERYAFMGFSEVISGLTRIISLERKLRAIIDTGDIDLFIPVDYPGMNLRLSKYASKRGVPVMYYISPQVWAWGKWRIKKMKKRIDIMTVILPFEKKLYDNAGIPAFYAGHPALNKIPEPKCKKSLPDEAKDFSILLFPGSRPQEVKMILPPVFDSVRRIRESFPEASFILGLAPIIGEKDIYIPDDILPFVRVSRSGTEELSNATIVIAASGTVTLQTALSGTPMVTVYKTTNITYAIGKMLIQIPYVVMPNVLAGREIVPELVQKNATGIKIADEALKLLTNSKMYREMSGELLELREKLKGGGGVSKVAEIAVKMARGENIKIP